MLELALVALAVAAAIVALAALSIWSLNLRDQNAGYRDRVAAWSRPPAC